MKERDEDKRSSIIRRSQKLDELEKNGNCSFPHMGRRWRSTARQAVPADKNSNVAQQVAPTRARPFCLLIRQ